MHFSKCKSQNVFEGCSQRPHGHFWDDEDETHELTPKPWPPLTSKEVALEVAKKLVKILHLPALHRIDDNRKGTQQLLKLKREINDTDLPESEQEATSALKKAPHLKIVK